MPLILCTIHNHLSNNTNDIFHHVMRATKYCHHTHFLHISEN